ncbi:MAG TPA: hypothetical protein VNS55_00490 [Nocardioides sp.]|nr:hypothetical protein [Nocardioides sp.]
MREHRRRTSGEQGARRHDVPSLHQGGGTQQHDPPASVSHLLSLLPEIEADIEAGERRLRACVRQLRERRATWREIGEALQVSRQAAWQRFQNL